MRDIIKGSAQLFIFLGIGTVLLAAWMAFLGFSKGAGSSYASYPEQLGLIVALAGTIAGASLVLVGGTAYLLASIDQRIEQAQGRSPHDVVA